MQRTVDLPVGPHPGWELEGNGDAAEEPQRLRSIAESLVVLQSLKQSRNKWLSATFPKFSAKARGGRPPDVIPPPHTIKAHGRYDLKIGPHIFHSTAFYEVHYLPQPPTIPSSYSQPVDDPRVFPQMSPAYNTSGQPLSMQPSTAQLAVSAVAAQNSFIQPSTAPLPHGTGAIVTPEMLAASGRASSDQLKTLGLLIQSLGQSQQPDSTTYLPPASGASNAVTAPLGVKDFDIVIEFQEKPSDRWIIPRGPAVCKRDHSNGSIARVADVKLSMAVPFPHILSQQSASATGTGEANVSSNVPPCVVTFHLSRVPQMLWDILVVWSGTEQGLHTSTSVLKALEKNAPPRSYLQYQLPDGPLLQEVQSAVAPSYATKPVMPSNADSSRARRRTTSRKGAIHPSQLAPGDVRPPTKRKSKPKPTAQPPLIACRACGQTDVPLMMGGRYCRVCIDAGRTVNDIPQLPYNDYGSPRTFISYATASLLPNGPTGGPIAPSSPSIAQPSFTSPSPVFPSTSEYIQK